MDFKRKTAHLGEAATSSPVLRDVGVAFFGDGAAEEGSLHESLNMARVMNLPMIFVCENNLFSSHLHIRLRQPSDRVARYADAHRVRVEVVDGNDVNEVQLAARRLIDAARKGEGPGFLEAVTYRWRGHVGAREDNDVGLQRKDDLKAWKGRDPIRRLNEALLTSDNWTAVQFAELHASVGEEIEEAWRRAEAAPYPETSALWDYVYAQKSEACQ